MSEGHKTPSRFNAMDLLIMLAATTIALMFFLSGRGGSRSTSLDVKRVATVKQIAKGLELYITKNGQYPPKYEGCINDHDPISSALYNGEFLKRGGSIADPVHPSDIEKCIYYEGTPSDFKIRYTLESDTGAGSKGDHLHIP